VLLSRILFSILAGFVSVISAADDSGSKKPSWVEPPKAPARAGQKCYLGIASAASTREKALDEAYKGALIEAVRREFPQLISISEKSSESLKGASYNRVTIYQSDKVQFLGLYEDTDIESPYVEPSKDESFSAYRVLCWPNGAIEVEKARQAAAAKSEVVAPATHFDSLLPPGVEPGPTGGLEIVTSPAGVQILLDAAPLGLSNASFDKVVQGSYEVVLSKEGYEPKKESVIVTAGKVSKYKFELAKIKSKLSIVSEPQGARIYVDNKPLETTAPVEIEEDVGKKIQVRVELFDYEKEVREFTFTEFPKSETFSLRMAPGKISVISKPSKATLYINDAKRDGSTQGIKLPGGQYQIRLEAPGYENYNETIEVRASKPRVIIAKLNPLIPAAPAPKPANKIAPHTYTLWSAFFTGVSAAAYGYYSTLAERSYDEYKKASNTGDAVKYRKETKSNVKSRDLAAEVAGGLFGMTILCFSLSL
jgi:hypothetical protein